MSSISLPKEQLLNEDQMRIREIENDILILKETMDLNPDLSDTMSYALFGYQEELLELQNKSLGLEDELYYLQPFGFSPVPGNRLGLPQGSPTSPILANLIMNL
jgi:hypothetical protein